MDNLKVLADAEPEMPEELSDRAADNWNPLVAIADLAGREWPKLARRAALSLSGAAEESDGSVSIQLLADLRNLFDQRDADRLPSTGIVDALAKMEDRPWAEWKAGKPLSVHQLARLLKPFGIAPRTVRDGSELFKGYLLEQFDQAFSSYLPRDPLPGRNTDTMAEGRQDSTYSNRNTDPFVTGRENGEKPHSDYVVTDVSDRREASGGNGFPGPCHACRGRRYWLGDGGALVCAVCHPPACPEAVGDRWYEIPWPDGENPEAAP